MTEARTRSPLLRLLEVEMSRAGITMAELSRRAGLHPSAVHAMYSGKSQNPRSSTIEALARALGRTGPDFAQLLQQQQQILQAEDENGVDADSLVPGDSIGQAGGRLSPHRPYAAPADRPIIGQAEGDAFAPIPVPPRQPRPRDVPVYGVAAGSDGEASFNLEWGHPIDFVARPPGIAAVRSAFAMYVANDSMEPRYYRGELVYANPRRPAAPGDHVIVVLRGTRPGEPPACFVKRLRRRSGDTVTVQQYNPAEEVAYRTDQVDQIIRSTPWDELLGV
ncbi:MAG: S24 family peptidase [Alphaproteobacteria bacterium]